MNRILLLLFSFIFFHTADAQVASSTNYWQMELERRTEEVRIQDSIFRAQDSLQMRWVKAPLVDRPNQFLDSLKDAYTIKGSEYSVWKQHLMQAYSQQVLAKVKPHRMRWTLGVFAVILILFATIKLYYSTELMGMMHAFINHTAFLHLNKEENIYNKWPFVLLFTLFSFVVGLFLFLGTDVYFPVLFSDSIQVFLLFSGAVFFIILLKVLFAKALGYIFEVKSLAKEYISVLYLCYFNAALFLIPVLLMVLLFRQEMINTVFISATFVLILSLAWQVLRASIYTLKAYKFSKFYLILYFCTLEIGPMVVLIKLLNNNLT